jgi:hypothetical protein
MFKWLEEEIAEYEDAKSQYSINRSRDKLLAMKQEAIDVLGCLYYIDLDKRATEDELLPLIQTFAILAECPLTADMIRAWGIYQESRARTVTTAQLNWMSDIAGRFSQRLTRPGFFEIELPDHIN